MVNNALTPDSREAMLIDQVLIITDDPQSALIVADQFSEDGKLATIVTFDGRKLNELPANQPTAVLFYFRDYFSAIPTLKSRLSEHFQGADIPYIGALSRQNDTDTSVFDSVIYPPAHAVQIKYRVNAMMRLSRMQSEITERIKTLRSDFGIEYPVHAVTPTGPFKILFIGKASPDFMGVLNALEQRGVETVAAFTSFSAFDYLHEAEFDAVLINMQDGPEPGLTICETMRRNSRLYHVPTLLLTMDDFLLHREAYMKGASDIIPFGNDPDDIATRVWELSNYHALQKSLKQRFNAIGGLRCTDRKSGTFNHTFFFAHLKNLQTIYQPHTRPTAVMLIRFIPEDAPDIAPFRIDAACDKAGAIIKNMVRMEDVVARLDEQTYAVAFPGQSLYRVRSVAERLQNIVANTVFDKGSGERAHFGAELQIEQTELNPTDNPDILLGRLYQNFPPLPLRQTNLAAQA